MIAEDEALIRLDLAEMLGDHWAMTLWGCAFEDFLTREVEGVLDLWRVERMLELGPGVEHFWAGGAEHDQLARTERSD